jgi:large subunit ribosomal protein L24
MTPEVVYDYNKDFTFDQHAPWTKMATITNDVTRYKQPVIVPPLKEWFFFRGDKVQIIRGKDAGKQGFVSAVIRQRNWVFVKGLNTV